MSIERSRREVELVEDLVLELQKRLEETVWDCVLTQWPRVDREKIKESALEIFWSRNLA